MSTEPAEDEEPYELTPAIRLTPDFATKAELIQAFALHDPLISVSGEPHLSGTYYTEGGRSRSGKPTWTAMCTFYLGELIKVD